MKILEVLGNNELSQEKLDNFSNTVKNELGLKDFTLFLTRTGDIKLASIIVPKELHGNGIGSKAMLLLNNFADNYNKRVILTTGSRDDNHGTTSTSRLKKFYKRFGYLENKGRNKDFTVSDNMYRKLSN